MSSDPERRRIAGERCRSREMPPPQTFLPYCLMLLQAPPATATSTKTKLILLSTFALLLALARPGDALVVAAPDACGGRRVATHASAFFGPAPAESGVLRAPIYAPYPVPPPPPSARAAAFAQEQPRDDLVDRENRGEFVAVQAAINNPSPDMDPAKSPPPRVAEAAAFSAAPASAFSAAPSSASATASAAVEPPPSPLPPHAPFVPPPRPAQEKFPSPITTVAPAPAPAPVPPTAVDTTTAPKSSVAQPWNLVVAALRVRRKMLRLHERYALGFAPFVATVVSSTSLFATRAAVSTASPAAAVETSTPDFGHETTKRAPLATSSLSVVTDLPVESRQAHMYALYDACDPLQASIRARAQGHVAVVARGSCDFSEKVLHMQRAGALAVVVVNYQREGERLANMKLNESKVVPEPILIPAVMISFKDWLVFAPCRADGVNVSFTAEGEATFDIDYGRDALNWAMMRGMALWILCQCGVNVIRYKRRISELRARADAIAALPIEIYSRVTSGVRPKSATDDSDAAGVAAPTMRTSGTRAIESPRPQQLQGTPPSPPRTIPLVVPECLRVSPQCDEEMMNDDSENSERRALIMPDGQGTTLGDGGATAAVAMAVAVAPPASADEDEPVCAVCLDGFEEGQRVRRLDCTHLYHAGCLDPWLTQSSNCCPVCKREVPNLPPPPTMLHYGSMSV